MNGYHILEFPLTDDPPPARIQFLPYGTRVLKVRVTNPHALGETLLLHSVHLPPGFGQTCAYSHEDEGTDFRLSWGGGHDRGACLWGADRQISLAGHDIRLPFEECRPLPSDREAWVYLNLHHLRGPFDRPRTLTLGVYPADRPQEPPRFRLPVHLEPPTVADPVRLTAQDGDYTFRGRQVPAYLPRWWSPATVTYTDTPPPNLHIRLDGNRLTVDCQTAHGPRRMLELFDHIAAQSIQQGRAWDADLFHFGGPFFVLRLWFFWLWQGGLAFLGQEVPDVERFDLLFHAETGQVRYVATDTHWRESWTPAPADGSPVEGHIGLFSRQVLERLAPAEQRDFEAYLDYVLHGAHQDMPPGVHIPALNVARELGLLQATRAPAWVWPEAVAVVPGVLAVGPEAHVPYFSNCPPPPPGMVSSDPREG